MSGAIPKVTDDPRWKAARALVESGNSAGAVDMFATLTEEAIARYSETSLEAAVCYYEYGNALLRSSQTATETSDAGEISSECCENNEVDSKPIAAVNEFNASNEKDKDTSGIATNDGNVEKSIKDVNDNNSESGENVNTMNDANSRQEDYELALEMMENAYSIYEDKLLVQGSPNEWIKLQLPRVLQGLGDVLREMGRKTDAVDVYCRALPYRIEFVERHPKEDTLSMEHLKNRRLLVEANILIAEALLECDPEKDVITSETKQLLVSAKERVDYARGYYDKARDELQDTVFLMGRIAAAGKREGFAKEKENICFTATLLMAVGESLAACDEENLNQSVQPLPKKLKK
jgi:tetratricopeptide (TPR) repeat protein